MTSYAGPRDGLPPQTTLHTGRAVFTESYAVIPRGVMTEIVTSLLPGWTGTRAWIIARPMSGFSETFSHYILDITAGGYSADPEPDPGVEAVLFVTEGRAKLLINNTSHVLQPGSYAYLPPGLDWRLTALATTRLHWIRKLYEPALGWPEPQAFVTADQSHAPTAMPDTNGCWATTRFVANDDLSHDMQVNIVTFQPGGVIPFEETHVMEHGLYVLEGRAVYKLNRDWVEVEAGDFMWLRAFCPQACYAAGPGPFRYLLYKDVNRHARLRGPGAFGALR